MSGPDIKVNDVFPEGKMNQIPLETAILLMNNTVPDMTSERFLEIAQKLAPNEVAQRYEIIIPDKEKVRQGKAKEKAVYVEQPHVTSREMLEIVGKKLQKLHPDLYRDAPKRVETILMDAEKNESVYVEEVQKWVATKGQGTEIPLIPAGKGI